MTNPRLRDWSLSTILRAMRRLLILILWALAGCSSGAVVFAPTPAPPDLSPLVYSHPSGAFTVMVPRQWPVFTQNATTLAAASFSTPDSSDPLVTIAVINLGSRLDGAAFADLIDQYQTTLRPDLSRYKEESRQAMGDGSWRMTGLRRTASGATQQVNTFMERSGGLLGLIEAIVPDDAQQQAALQALINSVQLQPESSLQATDASALVSLSASDLDVLNLATWSNADGVFYVTGEIANNGPTSLVDLPIQAVLRDANGLVLAEAEDRPLGYAVMPGGFAPFSLRFGQGQPVPATHYDLILGGADWQPQAAADVYGPGDLDWIDDSSFDEDGALVISGTVTNIGSHMLRDLRATATVFAPGKGVIGARFVDLDSPPLGPNESTDFRIVLPELGGVPAQYIVNVQAKGEANDLSNDTGA